MTHFSFTAISYKWKFLAYHLPFQFTQKKHNQWSENETIEDLVVSVKYHKIWLPNEVKFSGLTLVVGENLWFTLRKPTVIQNT